MAAAMETMRNAEDIAKADMKVKLAKVKADARDAAGAAKAEMRRRIAAARVQGQASATGGQPVAAAGLATAEVRESARNAHHKAAELAAKFRGQRLALEIVAGCMALSGAIAELGMGLFVPMDNLEGKHPWADIENPNIQQCVLAAIDAGLLWYMHFATPCKLWSLARTTGSSAVPIAVITFTVMALERVAAFNHNASQWQRKPMIVSIENPDRSMLFSVPEIEAVMKKLGMRQVRYSCCAFGASYRKDSVIWTNGPLDPLGRRCEDLPQHTHADTLEGLVSMTGADGKQKAVWKTALSAAYVPGPLPKMGRVPSRCSAGGGLRPPGFVGARLAAVADAGGRGVYASAARANLPACVRCAVGQRHCDVGPQDAGGEAGGGEAAGSRAGEGVGAEEACSPRLNNVFASQWQR